MKTFKNKNALVEFMVETMEKSGFEFLSDIRKELSEQIPNFLSPCELHAREEKKYKLWIFTIDYTAPHSISYDILMVCPFGVIPYHVVTIYNYVYKNVYDYLYYFGAERLFKKHDAERQKLIKRYLDGEISKEALYEHEAFLSLQEL